MQVVKWFMIKLCFYRRMFYSLFLVFKECKSHTKITKVSKFDFCLKRVSSIRIKTVFFSFHRFRCGGML